MITTPAPRMAQIRPADHRDRLMALAPADEQRDRPVTLCSRNPSRFCRSRIPERPTRRAGEPPLDMAAAAHGERPGTWAQERPRAKGADRSRCHGAVRTRGRDKAR